jgi:HEAT repeat protein
MRAPLSLLLLLAAPLAGAQGPFDDVLVKFRSPDKQVRHRAVDQFIRRYDAVRANGNLEAKGRLALEQYRSFRYVGRFFKEAVDAGEAKPGGVRAKMLHFAKLTKAGDYEPHGEPSMGFECGGVVDLNAHDAHGALGYLVDRRPEIARNLIAEPAVKQKGLLFRLLWSRGEEQDQRIALRMVKSPKLGLRLLGIQAMAAYPTGEAQNHVLAAAEDPCGWLRLEAAKILPIWHSDRAERALLRLLDDPNEMIGRIAAFSLRDFRSTLIVNAYRQRLAGDKASQDFAAAELAYHPDPTMVGDLVRRIQAEDYRFLDALAAIDSPKAREALLYFSESYEAETRAAVLRAMRLAKGPEIEARLIRGLRDPSPGIVSAALFSVTSMGMRSALPTLATMHRYELGERWAVEGALRACLGLSYSDPLPMQR